MGCDRSAAKVQFDAGIKDQFRGVPRRDAGRAYGSTTTLRPRRPANAANAASASPSANRSVTSDDSSIRPALDERRSRGPRSLEVMRRHRTRVRPLRRADRGGERRPVGARDADQDDAAAGPGQPDRRVDGVVLAGALERDVDLGEPVRVLVRPGRPAGDDRAGRRGRRGLDGPADRQATTSVMPACRRHPDDEQSDRPASDDRGAHAGPDGAEVDGMEGHAERLEQAGLRVGDRGGDLVREPVRPGHPRAQAPVRRAVAREAHRRTELRAPGPTRRARAAGVRGIEGDARAPTRPALDDAAISWPSTSGRPSFVSPMAASSYQWRSEPHSPTAVTRNRTSPGPASASPRRGVERPADHGDAPPPSPFATIPSARSRVGP